MSDGPISLLVSGNFVNVGTGTISELFVTMDDGRTVAFEKRPAIRELDAEYITPGLIDAHMHVESSMVTPLQYADAVVPRGVTGVVHDPHEIANANGVVGVETVMVDAARTPPKVRSTVPPSVPATTLQDRDVTLDVEAVNALLKKDEVVTLGEVMNASGVVAGDDSVHEKIRAARDHRPTVGGHAPRVCGSDLQTVTRYLDNDYESISLAETRGEVEAGFRVYLREGPTSKNLADVVGLVDEVGSRQLSLCTDDGDVVDLVERDGVDFAVREAIRSGVSPVEAVRMAIVSTTESYGSPSGRIQPGALADLALLSDLRVWEVNHIVVDGVIDSAKGGGVPPASTVAAGIMRLEPVSTANLAVRHAGNYPVRVRVIDAVGGLQTGRTEADVPVASVNEERALTVNADDDVPPLTVVERHGEAGDAGRGFVRGLGLRRGAVESTMAHDAHNCIAAGVGYDSMTTMVGHPRDIDGGAAAYNLEDDALPSLVFPMGGLMPDESLGIVKETFESVEATADDLGLDRSGGLMALPFLAFEVTPTYRLANNGLVDAEPFEYVPTAIDWQ